MRVEKKRRLRALALFVLAIVVASLVAAPWAVEAIVAPEPEVALGPAREPPADPNVMAFVVLPALIALLGVALAVAAIRTARRAVVGRASTGGMR